MPTPPKRIAYCTLGCRLNQYDTETIRTLIERSGGYQTVALSADAEVYVVNTCSVTANADASARKTIRRLHREHPEARIVVTGCYAQRAAGELATLPGVKLVFGAAERAQVPQLLAAAEADDSSQPRCMVSPIETARHFIDVPISEMMEHSRAYVKVQEGCNEHCSFCIVPTTRGVSRSRSQASVLAQIRQLLDKGYNEIVLTGVHLGDYGLDLPGGQRQLVALVERILSLEQLQRFRLSSIEPASLPLALIDLMAAQPRFARHFHLPLQSASDAVLCRMRRRYRAADFIALTQHIAERIPQCGIGADVICGFPTETDADFQQTFDALAALPISYLHPFSYSPRPGSEAEALGDRIAPDTKKRRIRALKRLVGDKNLVFRRQHVGQTLSVLVESSRRGGAAQFSGWSDNYIRVVITSTTALSPGQIVPVRITATSDNGLQGIVEAHAVKQPSPGGTVSGATTAPLS